MRRTGIFGLAAVFLVISGCGGDDGGADLADREEEARDAVTTAIAAYQEHDFETLCDISDQRVNESIPKVTKTETCPEGYEELFSRQKAFAGSDDPNPFDDFVKLLQDYEVGEATLTEEDGGLSGEVALGGPEEVMSLVVEEDGVIKVSELFVTPDANTNPGSFGQ